jgi:hypothetical protein
MTHDTKPALRKSVKVGKVTVAYHPFNHEMLMIANSDDPNTTILTTTIVDAESLASALRLFLEQKEEL